ncbi:MAG: inorganic phosphate transporter [Mucilaginibacter sp.]
MINATILPLIGDINLEGLILAAFLFCFLAVLGFEFVNGFHDTANAVATVIYTKTLKPHYAIVWSGIWNFLGVFIAGTAVALTLVKLIPLDKLITLPIQVGACLVIAILLSSIVWNLGSWFFGIPLSSTHTLVGAMIGGSLGFAYFYGGPGVNWSQALNIGLSLLISPLVGFGGAALLMSLEKRFIKSDRWFHIPDGDSDTPPLPIRILLVTTCTLVSFFHGSNDGQKGVGLLMLILIVFLPASFAFNPAVSAGNTVKLLNGTELTLKSLTTPTEKQRSMIGGLVKTIDSAKMQVNKKASASTIKKFDFRKAVQKVTAGLKKITEDKEMKLDPKAKKALEADAKNMQRVTDFAPVWVIACISISLGLGTMIGWKRIVVTIGEKIGNEKLDYAQGATAEMVAAATIGLSTGLGLPVSTTHVLSSGVAGAMHASKGTKNLNYGTLKSIAMAWVLTLPVAIALAFLLFMLFHLFIK